MEIVIPPRDHGSMTYKYNWDDNGEVTTIQRIGQTRAPSRGGQSRGGQSRGRQTVHWPFQSVVTEDSIPVEVLEAAENAARMPPKLHCAGAAARPVIEAVPEESHRPFRPRTWQPRSRFDSSLTAIDRSLIPDYVVNYLRGETPETLARRKAEQQQKHLQSRLEELARSQDPEHGGREGRASFGSSPSHDGSEDQILGGRRGMRGEKSWMMFGRSKGGRGQRPQQQRRASRQDGGGCFPTHGWRAGVACNLFLALVILAAGVVCLILAARRRIAQASDSASAPTVAFYARSSTATLLATDASCRSVRTVAWVLRAVLAALSVAVVGAAQYVFQIASSPSRAAVDAAHARRQWLDIGVPSLRNAFFLLVGRHAPSASGGGHSNRSRPLFGLVVVAAALASAVVYNALVVVIDVDAASASSATTTCDLQVNTPLLGAAVGLNAITAVCFLLVLLPAWSSSSSSNRAGREQRHAPLVTLGDAIASFLRDPDPTTAGACLLSKADVEQGRWMAMAGGGGQPTKTEADSAERENDAHNTPNTQNTQNLLQPTYYRPQDYYWVRAPSLARWLVGSLAWWTLAGLATAALVLAVMPSGALGRFGQMDHTQAGGGGGALYRSMDVYFTSTSVVRPAASSSSSTTALLASLPQLGLAVLYLLADAHLTVYFLAHEATQHATTTNGRRPLRVSGRPAGCQTTSLYLTLPRVWSWLLLVLFAGLSFTLGQGLVVSGVRATSAEDGHTVSQVNFALGCSAIGLLAFLALLLVLAVLVLGLGCRRSAAAAAAAAAAMMAPQDSALFLPGGSCSAVISARCHPAPDEARGGASETVESHNHGATQTLPLWQRPLAWGALPAYDHPQQPCTGPVPGMTSGGDNADATSNSNSDSDRSHADTNIGHCTYSARQLVPMDLSRSYA